MSYTRQSRWRTWSSPCERSSKERSPSGTVRFRGERRLVETDAFVSLTPREEEVFGRLARGWTNQQVARALVVSEKTVESHRATLRQKLGFADRREMVELARLWGLLAIDDREEP
ncbi:MAG: helix-turn-helix transcriptional regulator [Deltaproteobacteria bacterium]|nr:helix-turn-helix transcriptional regulator [Deltaproteobacteria bacterium]